jgi:hypothetical protein
MMKTTSFDSEMRKIQKQMLSYAEELARNKGKKLDYTDKSIRQLDVLLESIAEEFREAGISKAQQFMSEDSSQGIAESIGSYIVECIEKNHEPGEWVEADEQSGQTISYKTSKGVTIFPFDWVIKKMIDPKGYSVSDTYKEWVL